MFDEALPSTGDYRTDPVGPVVRLPGIEETPIGQEAMFGDLAATAPSALLTSRFVVPPFSVLDSRAGYWQARKAQWLALGIRGELGRGDDLLYAGAIQDFDYVRRREGTKPPATPKMAAPLLYTGTAQAGLNAIAGTTYQGTSIFDPVLCEIAYRWFCPPGGAVLDPFAGGSVRGIVAAMLGHRYTGIDLSEQQVAANRLQAESILAGSDYHAPVWIEGDSANMNRLLTSGEAKYDLVFSCPPYYDLEVYSQDPGELSAFGTYEEFLRAYRLIIGLAAARLKPERFVVWVIGEIRGKDGWQRGLVTDTIIAFRDAGLHLYNEAVLLTSVGTAALRVPRQFIGGRTLVRTHQSVLVFWNGAKRPAWRPLE